MRDFVQNFRLILIGGTCCAVIAACAPSSQMTAYDANMQSSYGYSQTGYGYESSETRVETHKSRYGGQLRGACEVAVPTCGFMQVVPVYPVYQIVTAPQVVDVPVVEAPPTVVYEPAPEPVYIPELELPTYVPPVQHWPEPETPAPTWTPLRK